MKNFVEIRMELSYNDLNKLLKMKDKMSMAATLADVIRICISEKHYKRRK